MKKTFTLNKITSLLFILFVIVTAFGKQTTAQCVANFASVQTANNEITFTNTSTGTGFLTNYFWSFGEGYHDYSPSPIHQYTIPGTYVVCLDISDSLSCNDSVCQTIVVTGITCTLAISVTSTDATCSSCTDGTATVTATGGSIPYNYLWSPAGTSFPNVSALAPGVYYICVTDANGCVECDSVLIGPTVSPGCSAAFSLYPDTMVLHSYWGLNLSTGVGPFAYLWSWGDGTSDTAAYPSHTYASAGVYTICLSVYDAAGCSNTYCDSMYLVKLANAMISVNIIANSPTGVNENVMQNPLSTFPNPASDYAVIGNVLPTEKVISVIIFDSIGNILAIENVKNNRFDVTKIPQGIYITKFLLQNGKQLSAKLVIGR